MSTSKPRIQAYVGSGLYQQFEQDREAWGLSQSQALERILSERYQADKQIDSIDSYVFDLQIKEVCERLNILEKATFKGEFPPKSTRDYPSEIFGQIVFESSLEAINQQLLSELPSELESELESVTSELPSELPSELESVTSELPSELNLGLSQRALSKRLGCSHAYIGKKEQERIFTSLSASLDPQGISWELKGKKYYPTGKAIASTSADLKADTSPFVIYAFDREAKQYYYWEGVGKERRGFGGTLPHALKYKTRTTAQKSLEGIYQYKDNHLYSYAMDANRFKIAIDSESFLRENRHTGITRDR